MSINDNNSIRTASTEAIMTQGPVVLIQEGLLCKWKTGGDLLSDSLLLYSFHCLGWFVSYVLPALLEFYFVLKGELCTDSSVLKMYSTSLLHFLSPQAWHQKLTPLAGEGKCIFGSVLPQHMHFLWTFLSISSFLCESRYAKSYQIEVTKG